MANNILGLVLDVLNNLPALITDGEEALQLIHSTVSTVEAAQAQGRDPTQAEWDAIHRQIDDMTGRLDAPETSTTAVSLGAVPAEAVDRGDGSSTPTARPEDVVGTAANPDPANVSPGPMFDEAHGAPGSTNVSLSTGNTVNVGGMPVTPDTADSLKPLDDHPRVAPSDEASQQVPVNPALDSSQQAPGAPVPPVSETTAENVGSMPPAALTNDAAVSGNTATPNTVPSNTQSTFDSEKAAAEHDLADFEDKARKDLGLE